jgi:CDP-glucose 4,6-dehydratase
MLDFWKGKRVFISGHTGFCGSWLALSLTKMGSKVCGYALDPPTEPSLFQIADVADDINSVHGDICDYQKLSEEMSTFRPEVVFHLAAQSLVIKSYDNPIETYATNVIGSLHMLEAAKNCDSVKSFVNVTTDKCYQNDELGTVFDEAAPLGGNDIYSSSKACVEILSQAFRKSYLSGKDTLNKVEYPMATVRAGNIIAGGDWAENRIIPDCARAYINGGLVTVRNPSSVRPWQHVLDVLNGYMQLGEKLYSEGASYAEAWNLGPDTSSTFSVEDVIMGMKQRLDNKFEYNIECDDSNKESGFLSIDSTKALSKLGWHRKLSFEKSLDMTADWYRAYNEKKDMKQFTINQFVDYQNS